MRTSSASRYLAPPSRLQIALIAATLALFLGALLSDIAYFNTYEIQWSNFASWLIAGGLVFLGFALLASIISVIRVRSMPTRPIGYCLLVLFTWALGLINAFEHAKDAWAVMPFGLVLSVIVTALTLLAMGLAFVSLRSGDTV